MERIDVKSQKPGRRNGSAPVGRRKRKQAVKNLLDTRDLNRMVQLVEADQSAVGVLLSFLYEKDLRLLWRGIEAFGQVAASKFLTEPETVRDWIRRQIWAMNEESGNMAWYAPETISEIVIRIPPLIKEYATVMASNIDEPVFRRGVFFACARIAVRNPEPFDDMAEQFAEGLVEDHPTIRASASLLLGALGEEDLLKARPELLEDDGQIPLYNFRTGEMESSTVSRIAGGVLGGSSLPELILDF